MSFLCLVNENSKMIHLWQSSMLLSRFCWWRCAFCLSGDMREGFPKSVCLFPGDKASWTLDAWLQWGWPRRDTKFMTKSWPSCWSNERRCVEVLRLMLRWMVVGKVCDEGIFGDSPWVTTMGLANRELKRSSRSVLTPGAGGCCCREGWGYSFRWAFFLLLIWVTWG